MRSGFTTEHALDLVCRVACREMRVPEGEIRGRNRRPEYALARHVCRWVARKETEATCAEAGDYFGMCDHSSCSASVRRVDRSPKLTTIAERIADIVRDDIRGQSHRSHAGIRQARLGHMLERLAAEGDRDAQKMIRFIRCKMRESVRKVAA